MTIRSIVTHAPLLAGLALALLLVPAPGANAACSDPAGSQVDWGECNLANADLRGANLSGADLTSADLRGANLSGADLTGANLTGADVWVANLAGADLTNADLTSANLDGADLTGAVLSEVNLSDATLGGTTWVDGRVCASGSVGTCD